MLIVFSLVDRMNHHAHALPQPEQRAPVRGREIDPENADAVARRGEAEALSRGQFALDALAEKLGLDGPPTRIECFDISNIQGTSAVGSMNNSAS